MRSVIDFAELDLRGALDFAILIEEDAQLRYEQLARLIGEDPGGAGDVFRMMIATEGMHRSVLVARRMALFQDAPARIEISVMDEGVERPDVVDDDLPRTAREALELSRAAERHAYEFYRDALPCLHDPGARAFFEELMAEELEHEEVLARRIAELDAPDPQGARRPARPPAPDPVRGPFFDREALEAALPHFDAATRAVARSVILDGKPEREVAAALGVSRRSVSRKLDRFLDTARRQLALVAAAATLAGCAGNLRSGAEVDRREPAPPQVEVQLVSAHVAGERVQRQDRGVLARKIRRRGRPPDAGYDSATHDRMSRAPSSPRRNRRGSTRSSCSPSSTSSRRSIRTRCPAPARSASCSSSSRPWRRSSGSRGSPRPTRATPSRT